MCIVNNLFVIEMHLHTRMKPFKFINYNAPHQKQERIDCHVQVCKLEYFTFTSVTCRVVKLNIAVYCNRSKLRQVASFSFATICVV
jgi:hypothetical protein